jgi:hypothetical protein
VGWRLVQVGAVCAARSLNGPGSFSAPALGPFALARRKAAIPSLPVTHSLPAAP